jgi:hypothetical protein
MEQSVRKADLYLDYSAKMFQLQAAQLRIREEDGYGREVWKDNGKNHGIF